MSAYVEIWDGHGYRRQCRKLVEEAYELAEAVVAYETDMGSEHHLAEELADVTVMLRQIADVYGVPQTLIDNLADYKVGRTLRRMKADG